jgi:hypothetical protein
MSPFCGRFVDIVHDPTLSLSTGGPLRPSAEVFAPLVVDDARLQNPPKDKHVFAHCDNESVMARLAYTMPDVNGVVVPNSTILCDNQNMIFQFSEACLEQLSFKLYPKTKVLCARTSLPTARS